MTGLDITRYLCCGMFAWAGNQTQPGGLYRVRYTGKPVHVPIGLKARKSGMVLTFSGVLDARSAGEARNYAVNTWSLKRSAAYGSKHYDEKALKVTGAKVSADGKTVTLELAGMRPTWCMEVRYAVKGANGESLEGAVHKHGTSAGGVKGLSLFRLPTPRPPRRPCYLSGQPLFR